MRLVSISFLYLATTLQVLAHGDLHEQIAQVSSQIANDPKNAMLYHKRGELHRAHEEYIEALIDYTSAQQLDPTLDVVFLSRGRALCESKNFTGSIEALNTFLSRNPGHAEGRWLRGRVLASLEHRDDAEKDFAQVLASPGETSPEQFIERAQNLQRAGHNEAALGVLADGLNRLGSLITLETSALDLEIAMRRYQEAIQRLDGLLEKAERKEAYLVRKADVFRTMGDKTRAHENYSKALQAIVALPSQQRNLKSTLKLEQEARAAFGRLKEVKPSSRVPL